MLLCKKKHRIKKNAVLSVLLAGFEPAILRLRI